jgi:hypothetical protein
MPVSELAIPGDHNVSNAMAAIAAALLFGVAPEAIRAAAGTFTGVEHRLEHVATWTACGSSTTRRGLSRTRSSPRCGHSRGRSCSLPAAATRAWISPGWVR